MIKKNILQKSRNPIFDLLRVVLTVFVINVHIRIITSIKSNILEPFTWYTVPLFIILSFFFLSNKPIKERLKRLFIPYIFWSIIGFLVHPNLLYSKNIFLQLLAGDVVNTPLYYLTLLILFTAINWLIDHLSSNKRIFVYSLIMVITLMLEYSNINYSFFSPMNEVIKKSYGRFVELIKYVPVGLLFCYLRKKVKNIYFVLNSILFFIFFLISFNIPQPLDFHYSGLKILTGSIAIFSLILGLSDLKFDNKINNFINLLGKYSFGVYLLHYLLLETILNVFPSLKYFINFNQYLFLFCYAVFCYLFCYIFDLITLKKFSFLVS